MLKTFGKKAFLGVAIAMGLSSAAQANFLEDTTVSLDLMGPITNRSEWKSGYRSLLKSLSSAELSVSGLYSTYLPFGGIRFNLGFAQLANAYSDGMYNEFEAGKLTIVAEPTSTEKTIVGTAAPVHADTKILKSEDVKGAFVGLLPVELTGGFTSRFGYSVKAAFGYVVPFSSASKISNRSFALRTTFSPQIRFANGIDWKPSFGFTMPMSNEAANTLLHASMLSFKYRF